MPAQIELDSGKVDASSKLSLQRTVLSHERTMLAWVRTSTSLITFGFGIQQFFRATRGPDYADLSSPRALADPVVDITDMFAFPSPQRSGTLVLVLNVSVRRNVGTFFGRGRLPLPPATSGDHLERARIVLAVNEKEYVFSCRFAVPVKRDGGSVQEGSCTTATGQVASFRVNDDRGGQTDGLRVFAGVRLDPFFFDGVKAGETIVTRKLAFAAKGNSTMFRQNVLSIVIELDVATMFDPGDGPLFAIVGETVTAGPLKVRLERSRGYQEPPVPPEPLRFRQPGYRASRSVQQRGRVQAGPRIRQGLSRADQLQSEVLGLPRREDRLAAGRAGRPSPGRSPVGRFHGGRCLEAASDAV